VQAFRVNSLVVTGLAPAADRPLEVAGRRFDGREVALFRGLGVPVERGLQCWFYLDGDIQELDVRFHQPGEGPGHLRFTVETRPRIALYGLGLADLGAGSPWFSRVDSAAALGPGDLLVRGREEGDAEALRAAGIHVLVLGASARMPADDPPSAWRGYLLRCPDRAAAGRLLERERGRLVEFKERCLQAVGGARADIAYTLAREELAPRVAAPLGYALLAFYAPVLAAAAALRRPRVPLILAGALLAGFVVFTLLSPGEVRSLRVEFPPPGGGERPALVRVAPGEYRQAGMPAGSPILLYQGFLAPGGELPLQELLREKMVRFNQVPEVRQTEGRLYLRFRNPLAAWSLHAPR
jgi:hypothetical protein